MSKLRPVDSMPVDEAVLVKYNNSRGGQFAVAVAHEDKGRDIYISTTDVEIDPDWLEGWQPIIEDAEPDGFWLDRMRPAPGGLPAVMVLSSEGDHIIVGFNDIDGFCASLRHIEAQVIAKGTGK